MPGSTCLRVSYLGCAAGFAGHGLRRRSVGAKQDSCAVSRPAFDDFTVSREAATIPMGVRNLPLTACKYIQLRRDLTETTLAVSAGAARRLWVQDDVPLAGANQ
jgi:hypothetical protein